MSTETLLARRSRQRGLSLIELLVGVAVGMIGILIIFQTMAVWDKHARTTTSGGDARTAGTLAIYNIERDLKLAGMGFSTAASGVMGCDIVVRGGMFNVAMAPVVITPNSTGPDTIDVLHGNSAFFVTEEKFSDSTAFTKKMKRRGGFRAGDLAVVAGDPSASGPVPCHMIQVTDVSNGDGVTLVHNPGSYTSSYTAAAASAIFNPVNGTGAGTFTAGTMYNLGPLPQRNRWEVVGTTLVNTDAINSAPAFQTAEGVIDVKAQYGFDIDGDMRIADAAEWSASMPSDWRRVLAVRVALLVRSRQFEKDSDTGAASAPTWFGNDFTMRNVDGTTDTNPTNSPNNWRNYRYRVYERIVPLRNMIWGTS